MSFEAITTQEQFEEALKARLEQKERSVRSEMESEQAKMREENASLKEQLGQSQSQIAELNGKINAQADYESQIKQLKLNEIKTKASIENGLPYSLAQRLQGEDEDSIMADAKQMAEFFKTSAAKEPPLKNTEPEISGEDSAYMALVKEL